jgi:hypothetical protein
MMKIRFRPLAWLAAAGLLLLSTFTPLPELAARLPVSRAMAQDSAGEKSQPTDSTKAAPADEKPAGKTIQGANVTLGHNAEGDMLWGFSDELGKLSKLKIPKPDRAIVPNIGNGFGFFLADGKIYGFSAKTGEWSQPELPENIRIFTSTTGGNIGVAFAADRIYGYSPTTGRWEELKTKAKPTLQFSKLVVDKDGETFIFSDVTGRWSSTADLPASADANDDLLKAEAMQKAISNMREKGHKSSGDSGTTSENPVVGQAGTGKKKGKGAAGGHAAGMTPGMPPGGPMGGSGTRGGGPMSGMGGMAGMGMAGMGGGPGRPANFIQGKNAALLINDAGDKIWGYSLSLGKWTGLSIPKMDKRPEPTLGSDVGIFTTDDHIYAYSSQTGRWDGLVTDGRKSAAVHQDKVVLMDGEKVHIFSNATGRWSSADDPTSESTVDRPLSSTILVEKFPYPLTDIQGRLIVRGDVNGNGDLDLFVSDSSERVSAAELLESLKSRSLDAEREAVQRALELRGGGPNQEAVNQLKARVEQAVREAFDRRQQAHRLEAEILRVKLQRVDARLVEREQNRDVIVARRLQQLIDSPETVAPLSDATNKSRTPSFGSAPGMTGGRSGRLGGKNPDGTAQSANRDDPGGYPWREAFGKAIGAAQAANKARPAVYSQYKSRADKTINVGAVSEVREDGRVVVSVDRPTRVHVGDELVVSRVDFVHEDGTRQYYTFARLFVLEIQKSSAVTEIVELATAQSDGTVYRGYEKIETGQLVGSEIINPDSRPEVKIPDLAPLQGRWRMERWVNGERVMPPGNLKGSRHLLYVSGNQLTLVDPGAGTILNRIQIDVRKFGLVQNGVTFLIFDGTTNDYGPAGIYRVHESTLKIGWSSRQTWGYTLEPGPAVTYWEFIRDEAVETTGGAASDAPAPVAPQTGGSDVSPSAPGGGNRTGLSGPRGGVGRGVVRSTGRGRSVGVPEFKPRVAATRTVGVVTGRDDEGRILLAPEEPSGIHVGDELVLSRVDFVHEDGTKQYNAFARLFVVQAQPDSAVAQILEMSRRLVSRREIDEFEPGQIVAIESVKPETKPEIKIPELVPLQGRWRMQRWVDDTRVLPPGDLKGSRHVLLINGDVLTLIDPSAGTILDRWQIAKLEKRPDVKGILFQIRRGPGGGGMGLFSLDETTLRISQQTGVGWHLEMEPGPDCTYWEFTRGEAAEKPASETTK